jgi:hypothetical protein
MKIITILLAITIATGCSEDAELAQCIDNADTYPGNWNMETNEPTPAYWDTVAGCQDAYPSGSY